jgi:hypothetical protein
MQWKVGDRIIYPGHLPGTIVVIDAREPAIVVLLDSGGRELLLGREEVALLKPQPEPLA